MFRSEAIISVSVCALVLYANAFGYSGGSGATGDPYQIASKEDLLALAATTTDYGKSFILTADISLTGETFTRAVIAPDTDTATADFQGTMFSGVFDGNGHTISNLTISAGATGNDCLGFFGCTSGTAVIKNLAVTNISITGTGGSDVCGGIAGMNKGNIQYCHTSGTISGGSIIGGMVGRNNTGSVTGCYSTASVAGTGQGLGGLVGPNTAGASITESYATGTVTGNVQNVGGLVSASAGNIVRCYATGNVSGYYAGGLVGNFSGGTVVDSYARGNVTTANSTERVGGLLGYQSGGSVSRCYSTGLVTGSTYVGGLIGTTAGGTTTASFWDTQTSGKSTSSGGTGKTTAEMQTLATFTGAGWDFAGETTNGTNDYWLMPAGSYPVLAFGTVTGTPIFAPAAGTYFSEQDVVITCATPGATIHYTTNGIDPNESDPVIASGATVLVDHSLTLKAAAWKSGFVDSAVSSASYALQVATPVFTPGAGTYSVAQNVVITCATAGATIHYTTNGASPTESDPVVASGGSILVPVVPATTLKARAWKDPLSPSAVAEGHYSYQSIGAAWTWVSGPNLAPPYGIYGIQGVPDANNMPALRSGAVTWRDAGGNLWLFGGTSSAVVGGVCYFNDLWKFDGTKWTWVSGSSSTDRSGVYGTKGIAAPGNVPGGRCGSISWTDNSGNLWLFGGSGYAASGNAGYLNDLWKFDGTNWTWVSGSSTSEQTSVYGTKGLAASDNVPGARQSSVSWIDSSGNLWLFGGYGHATSYPGYLNDLWKFDGTNWTWVSGSNATEQAGVYGTKGVPTSGNVPGARQESVSWIDGSGNLWLFGGYCYRAGYDGHLNDLWKFDGTNWTWVSGSDLPGQTGTYGTKGLAASGNVPGARYESVSWIDDSGNLWLFGGFGYAATGSPSCLNDLWKFNGTNWTWVSGSNSTNQNGVYGTKGVAASGNVPGAHIGSVSWIDGGGNLWLFGGSGYAASGGMGELNDLWRFDGANWTWVSGLRLNPANSFFGTKGVAAPENMPGARGACASWTDSSDNFWLFGGRNGPIYFGDLWKFDGNNWTWVSGSSANNQRGVYGTRGIAASSNVPGARSYSVSWIDGTGNLWLFGGWGAASVGSSSLSYLNDLWKFDGTNWTWVSGSDLTDQLGIYGTKGVAAYNNVPGARKGSVSWIDGSGKLWLFGGEYQGAPYNDLWRFDGTYWTWISGYHLAAQRGVYGTKGVASSGNVPGAREGSISWVDSSGNLWLFGGQGYGASTGGYLNDLWKFDGTNWTWVSGSSSPNQSGVYGSKGVMATSNVPGARFGSVSWIDRSGHLWLFGGFGYAISGQGILNDLWRFDGAGWTWVSGSNSANQNGVYGTKGVPASGNVPGARFDSATWVDNGGRLWLFGGGVSGDINGFIFNELWVFGISEQAADMTGDGVVDQLDLMTLADQWTSAPGVPSADVAPQPVGDGVVDFRDFAVLAGNWLEGK